MARKLPRSIAQQPLKLVDSDDVVLAAAREAHASQDEVAGGAWNAAGKAALGAELTKRRGELEAALLRGDLVFELAPDQIVDEVGSDRIGDWINDESFSTLKSSIEQNGQDTPIQVMPFDPDWIPQFDTSNQPITDGVRFRLVGGRRRIEALKQLKRSIRTTCVPVPEDSASFDQLHRRYRENAERENLSLFEEFVAIGELFESASQGDPALKARAFSKKLSLAEAKVSKARAVYKHRARIEDEIEEPNDLSLHAIDALLPALKSGAPLPKLSEGKAVAGQAPKVVSAPSPSAPTLTRTQIISGKKIVAKARKGRVTIDLRSVPDIDEAFLDHLLLFIAQKSK